MKKSCKLFYLVLCFASIVSVTACGAKSSRMDTTDSSIAEIQAEYPYSEKADQQELGFSSEEKAVENSASDSSTTTENTNVSTNRKLITRVTLSVETKEFDKFDKFIENQVTAVGGYIETSEKYGNSYYSENNSRSSSLVIRVPSSSLKDFVKGISDEGNITRQSSSQEDITLQYVDTKSHNESLKIEQDRLLHLLEKAEKLSDIITLEERLSQVRYEIETYESQLRTFDNLVDYSTITLEVSEVLHLTKVYEKTMGDRISSGFSDSLYNIKIGLQNFIVWLITALPYLIILTIVFLIIGFITRTVLRKKAIQKCDSTEKKQP